VTGVGTIRPGDDLPTVLLDALRAGGGGIEENDVLVVTSKVVSKAENRLVPLGTVVPSRRARAWARVSGRDPRICELVLRESRRLVTLVPSRRATVLLFPHLFPDGKPPPEVIAAFDREPTMLLAEMPDGSLATDAGIDTSNIEGAGDIAALLPEDSSESARRIREAVRAATGKTVAVVVSDTDLRFFRIGTMDHAVGAWGIAPFGAGLGKPDRTGRPKVGGVDALVDVAAAAASLAIGQNDEGVPAVLVRGMRYERREAPLPKMQVSPKAFRKWRTIHLYFRLRYLLALLGA
jgi:coenzyme F420-0:L-glutamate ligase/coenzyme F420-1:gamma-L-glutamate ligase